MLLLRLECSCAASTNSETSAPEVLVTHATQSRASPHHVILTGVMKPSVRRESGLVRPYFKSPSQPAHAERRQPLSTLSRPK